MYETIVNAIEWAESRDERTCERYWDILARRADAAYNDRSKQTIMRNQLHLGFNNNIWPALSRMLILDRPYLIAKLHPRTCELDCKEGRMLLLLATNGITGRNPLIEDWRDAKNAK